VFLQDCDDSEARAALDRERSQDGFVSNLGRVWAWRTDVADAFAVLRAQLIDASSLTEREVAILVCATASALGDSYCSLAWGSRLAKTAGPALAAKVLAGAAAEDLSAREQALRVWAVKVVRDPNGTSSDEIDALRTAGLSEREIFEATVFVSFRLAFSTVNDALGARPDREIAEGAPAEVRSAVSFGRAPMS
jgi:uncharacterized peroxidase-related enzyme